MAKYKMIEVLEMDDGFYTKMNVHYDDGTKKEFTGIKDCFNELNLFAKQEEIQIGDLIKSEDKVKYNLAKSDSHIETEINVSEEEKDEKPKEELAKDEEKKEEKKGFVKGLKIVASIVALATALGAGFHLCKNCSNKVSNNNKTNYEDDNYSQTDSNVEWVSDESDYVFTPSYFPEGDYLGAIDYIDELCLYNSYEIGEYVDGKNLSGDPLYIEYQYWFNPGTDDYYAVEYFAGLRDNCIRSAYFDKSRNGTKNAVENFCQKAAGFSAGNETISFITKNGKRMTLSKYNLSPSARHVICVMTMGAYNINDSTSVTYNGKNNSPDDVRVGLSDEYNNTMVELNNRYSR